MKSSKTEVLPWRLIVFYHMRVREREQGICVENADVKTVNQEI